MRCVFLGMRLENKIAAHAAADAFGQFHRFDVQDKPGVMFER